MKRSFPLRQYFGPWIDKLETDLSLDTSRISYRWCPQLGSRGKSTNPREEGSQQIRKHWVFLRTTQWYWNQFYLTLAHELRHVWQIQNGYLSWDNRNPFIWCGVPLPRRMLYQIAPHEIDARLYASHMVYGSSRPPVPSVTEEYRDRYAIIRKVDNK